LLARKMVGLSSVVRAVGGIRFELFWALGCRHRSIDDADPDIPILKHANAEYAKLQ